MMTRRTSPPQARNYGVLRTVGRATAARAKTVSVLPAGRRAPRRLSVIVAAGGLALTAVLAWTASTANHSSNNRLLRLQVRQTVSALSSALPSVQSQLVDALKVATATNSSSIFKSFVSDEAGGKGEFTSLSLWQRGGTGTKLLTFVGAEPELVLDGAARSFFAHVRPSATLQVTGILKSSSPRLGYAEMEPGETHYVVYAESALPASRKLVVPSSSAFSDLNFALYLGKRQLPSQLIEASVTTPIRGLHAVASLPFGNTAITVVGTPTTQLTGTLSASLVWIVVIIGAVLSLASATTVEYVARRRWIAERLAEDVARLYAEQHSIAETLQRAILPEQIPAIAGMEIAVRYLPGVNGVDVGGDWYDVVPLEEGRFVFVVGDVSGRGVKAAAVMASLHYASRGFALEGHPPEGILEQLAKTLDISRDEHFATVLVGLVDVARHQVTIANAGHLPPVLCSANKAAVVPIQPGSPIGISNRLTVEPLLVTVEAHATLIAYTDGLVERRGESLDEGIGRLQIAAERNTSTLEELLSGIVTDLTMDAPDDDIALIGLRWLD